MKNMNKKIQKSVSVIIPTFNRVNYLYPTLLCLTNQSIEETLEYEIIIVDSGDDETESLVHMFQNKFNVSILYKKIKKCKNRSLLRNTGAELANCSILCFLDNDMLTPPDFIQTHFDEHKKNPNTVIMGVRRFLTEFNINEFGEEKLIRDFNSLEDLSWYGDERLYEDMANQPWKFTFSHTLSIEKNDFYKAGKFDSKFGNNWGFEDLELGMRLQNIKCDFKLLTNTFTYHQPHFNQSRIEQNNAIPNRNLFLKNYNSFDIELWLLNTRDGLYRESQAKDNLSIEQHITAKQYRFFDKILGYINTSYNKNDKKLILGAVIPEPSGSLKNVYILETIFKYNEVVIRSILFEAFRVAKNVYFSKSIGNKLDEIFSHLETIGIKAQLQKTDEYIVFSGGKNYIPKAFSIVLPPVFFPQNRYVLCWLAKQLIDNKKDIMLRDLHSSKSFSNDDFRIDNYKTLEKYIKNRQQGNYLRQSIITSSNINESINGVFSDNYLNVVINDEDNSLSRKYRNTRTIEKSKYGQLVLYSVYEECEKLRKNEKKTVTNKKICCFMENGFYEDGIDLILKAFKKVIKEDKEYQLFIKLPDYNELFNNTLPWHNNVSRENKLFMIKNKMENERTLLLNYIYEQNLTNNVFILSKNMSMEEVVQFVDSNSCCVTAARTPAIIPELYIALLLNKKVIITDQQQICKDFLSKVFVLETREVNAFEAFKIPINCSNIGMSFYEIDINELCYKILSDQNINNEDNFIINKKEIDEFINEII